mmetsp:Transcript_34488/g.55634  ORF Transcript_34488/g.55634 Transcript_34488/m.55634 type:complete len:85 (-) Transcript_34488:48-302(-)
MLRCVCVDVSCMFVCLRVCMHMCVQVCMCRNFDAFQEQVQNTYNRYACKCFNMFVCMYVCMYVCTSTSCALVCMYECMYPCKHT